MLFAQKELSVGNRTLDSEHEKLHNIINLVIRSIIANNISAMTEAFDLLETCLHSYFAVEEKIAQTVNFDFSRHRQAHQDLLAELQRIKKELLARKELLLSKHEERIYVITLRNFMIRHVKQDAAPLKIVLETHLYDLQPEY